MVSHAVRANACFVGGIQCSCLPVRTEPGGGTDILDTVEKVEAEERFIGTRFACGEADMVGWSKNSSGAVSKRCNLGCDGDPSGLSLTGLELSMADDVEGTDAKGAAACWVK